LIPHDLPIHKEEVEKSIIEKFGALNACHDPLALWLFSLNGKRDFMFKDLFHQTHVNNLVHLNRSKCFYKMLFKRCHRKRGMVVKEPTPIEVPKDLKCTITKDKKEVANNNDTREASAFNIDMDHYTELSSKNFLELEEKLEVKKYNLALHYGVNPNEITPEFVKTFDREKLRMVWNNISP